MFLFFVLLALLLLIPLSLPLTIVLRYKVGAARRQARGWVAAINTLGMLVSAALFIFGAALSNVWVPGVLRLSVSGLTCGCVLGWLGVVLSRWEWTPRSLHYTPNRWLVLSLTAIVALRLGFNLWRAWDHWHASPGQGSWLAAVHVGDSMAAGGLVLGYYLTFWAGVWWRVTRVALE